LSAEACAVCTDRRLGSFGHGGACDVQVSPLHVLLDKSLKEGGSLRSSTIGRLSFVVQVRELALHGLTMLVHDRQSPEWLKGVLATLEQLLGQLVVITEQTSSLAAKSDFDGASQSRQVNELLWLEFSLNVGEGVSKNETSLSIGVTNLDSEPLHRLNNITRLVTR